MPAANLRYQTTIEALSFLTGLERCYPDFFGNIIQLETHNCAAMLHRLGAPASNESEAELSLEKLIAERLNPPLVVLWLRADAVVEMIAPALSQADVAAASVELILENENGQSQRVSLRADPLPDHAWLWRKPHPAEPAALLQAIADDATAFLEALRRRFPQARLLKLQGQAEISPNLYAAKLILPSGQRAFNVLAAAERCGLPPGFAPRSAGLMAQLYALRSEANMGLGEYADAAELARIAAPHGARTLMISPVHALFPGNPRSRSPYSPSSRRFYNLLHLRPAQIGEWPLCEAARNLAASPELSEWLNVERKAEQIDYPAIAARKLQLLRALHDVFRNSADDAIARRRQEFDLFRRKRGEALYWQALYDALYTYFVQDRRFGFQQWPEAYRRPHGEAVEAFARQYAEEIEFFEYAHWNAQLQFDQAARDCAEAGSALIADLAVGVEPGGADVWADRELFIDGVHIGAPPDPFAEAGQNWGLAALSPQALRQRAYRPLIELFQIALPTRGFVRIDHVMGLARLYLASADGDARAGAYVRYDFEATLAALSLACYREEGGAIGEDLGNAPDWLRARLRSAGVYSWKVFQFERDGDGGFASTKHYPPASVATMNTHDLATLPGWWTDNDLEEKHRRGLIDATRLEELLGERSEERRRFLEHLQRHGLLNEAIERGLEDSDPETLAILAAELLAMSGSDLRLLSLHDLYGEAMQPNVPGTVDEYPNWALRYRRTIDELKDGQITGILRRLAR